jgi:hypothetical protein
MKTKMLFGLISLLLIGSCREAPDLLQQEEIVPEWTASITLPEGEIYNGDTIVLKSVVSQASKKIAYYWKIIDPDGGLITGKYANISLSLTKVGDYEVTLEVTIGDETKTAKETVIANRRGVVISLKQAGGQYLNGDDLEFDSLAISCKITTALSSLGKFSISFGDGTVLDTVVSGSQTVINHTYADYGDYTLVFINSETINKDLTITKPNEIIDPIDPIDTTGGDEVYDENIATYTSLFKATTYADALYAKVDKANKKAYLLFSVTAAERPISPTTEVTWKGNWKGEAYGDWIDYQISYGSACVVTTAKGKYIKLTIKNYVEDFLYRGNIYLSEGVFVNAQNAAPYFGKDSGIGDTGTIRFIIKSGVIYPPK